MEDYETDMMKFAGIKAVLFDFDLTLVDSSEGVIECANLTLSQMKMESVEYAMIRKTIGMTLENSFIFMTGIDDPDMSMEYKDRYIENAAGIITNKTKWMKGAKDVLIELRNKGIKTGIVSTKIKIRLLDFLDKENFTGMFDVIIGGDEVKKNKPDPEGLILAMERLDLHKNEVLYVGDSLYDMDAAYNAEIAFAALLTGETQREEFTDGKVNIFIKSLDQLVN